MARFYFSRWLPGGKRVYLYSINVMRARHPAWFKEDLAHLFELLASRAIRPRVAGRISFGEVAEAHRCLEAGGLQGKLVLCPDLLTQREPLATVLLTRAREDRVELLSRSSSLFEHDLFGKPVSTFPDHALSAGQGIPHAKPFSARLADVKMALQHRLHVLERR